jgi:uncharacterized protein YggE
MGMRTTTRLLVVASLLLLGTPALAAAQDTAEHTLSVVGAGRAELRPDRGSFGAGVTLRSPTAGAARTRVNRRVAAIVRGLRALGVPREQIQTTGISIQRTGRRVGKDGPVRISFRASSSLSVAVDGLKRLGRAIDVASERGATELFGPQLGFTPELRAKGRAAAEAAALADARARADAAAAATGQRITGVQSIDLDPGADDRSAVSFSSADSGASGGGSSRAPTKVFAGRRRFSSEARVTYLIEPAA